MGSDKEKGEDGSPHGPPGTAGSVNRDGTVLPPIAGATGRRGTTAAGSRGGTAEVGEMGKKNKSEVQVAPPAPAQHLRSPPKKMQAIGHLGQPPRLHVAPLGGPYGYGVAQPPLGATMGHGLVRHGQAKESYFFPHPAPEIPALLKATSE